MIEKRSGILLHISSLPSPYGIGDFGPNAYRWVDFLSSAGQHYWQILPLNPTAPILGNSPYSSFSAFAGNNLFISLDFLVQDGFLRQQDLKSLPAFDHAKVDYERVGEYKYEILSLAYELFQKNSRYREEFAQFCLDQIEWLDDYAMFVAFKQEFEGRSWHEWPTEIRDRETAALKTLSLRLHNKIEERKFFQYLFFKQWSALHHYCHTKGIQVLGDLPIYVTYDSADVWANPEFFQLKENKDPDVVAGVPPDYFSETGQLWGNPLYRWDVLKENGYRWWIRRLAHNLREFDLVRLDHFRGLVAYWAIPYGEKTAVKGEWVPAPVEDFLDTLRIHFPNLPLVAEDLGLITDDVKAVMKKYGFPGMRVLLFSFDGDPTDNPNALQNHIPNCLVYTGTHDNNTVLGWFHQEAGTETKKNFFDSVGREIAEGEAAWEMIRLAMGSPANTAIVPMQDFLALGEMARMNCPGLAQGNWQWRMSEQDLNPRLTQKILELTKEFGRFKEH